MIVQHVLVPIDFSATADRALAYAIALAQQLQARLTLLHVLDLTPVIMEDMTAGMTATLLDDLETDAQHQLCTCTRPDKYRRLPLSAIIGTKSSQQEGSYGIPVALASLVTPSKPAVRRHAPVSAHGNPVAPSPALASLHIRWLQPRRHAKPQHLADHAITMPFYR